MNDSAPRVAIIDSGVYAEHPHVQEIAGGVAITPAGESTDYIDRLGHGTAVAAVIREKAPHAVLFAVKIFHDRLAASIQALVDALDWATHMGMDLVNLSLGTLNPSHQAALHTTLDQAALSGLRVVAAGRAEDLVWLPGSMRHPAVVPVQVDWDCPRHECYTTIDQGTTVYRASGFPRPIPGVPPNRNLSGISFAVANVTGLLARQMSNVSAALPTHPSRVVLTSPNRHDAGGTQH
jgi:subtilisin family serine protease